MGRSLAQNLIEHEGQTLDRQLQDLLPDAIILTSQKPKTQDYQYQEMKEEHIQDFHDQQQTDISEDISDSQIRISNPVLKTKKICKKNKGIENHYGDSSQNSSNLCESVLQAFKRPRKTKAKKPQYPTKNFLPNNKVPHLNFLKKHYPNCMIDYPDIAKIDKKDGISLKDYEYLYRIPECRPIFKKMFEQRILYRQLLLSRSDVITKLIHQQKLYVFEQAFNSQTFERIN